MTSCAYCGNTIVFGGARHGELRFCSTACEARGPVLTAAAEVPETAAQNLALKIRAARCPCCNGAGPVDVHTSYRVWSALVYSRWRSLPQLSCRRCGIRSQIESLAYSALLGWWGIPFGLLVTPVQIARNLAALISPPDPAQPSPRLLQTARIQLAMAEYRAAA